MQRGKGPLLVIATPQGQLGNSISHFAHIRAFAIKYNVPLLHLTFDPYPELFPLANTDLFSSYSAGQDLASSHLVQSLLGIFKGFLSVLTPGDSQVVAAKREEIIATSSDVLLNGRDPDLRHAAFIFGCALTRWVEAGQFKSVPMLILRAPDGIELDLSTDPRMQFMLSAGEEVIVLLDGWLVRAHRALEEHADEIRGYFTPAFDTTAAIERIIAPLRARAELLIGVHIRGRDYKEFLGGKFFWPVERYVSWMREVKHALPERRVAFLVCSDEQLVAEQFSEFDFSFGPGSAVADMYAFARCDAVFGPPSTFTGWAQFYGQNKLVFMQSAEDSAARVAELLRG